MKLNEDEIKQIELFMEENEIYEVEDLIRYYTVMTKTLIDMEVVLKVLRDDNIIYLKGE